MPTERPDHGANERSATHRVFVVLFCLVLVAGGLWPPVAAADEYPVELDEDFDLQAAGNQTVTGTANLDAGTQITVRVRSSGENPFLQQQQVTVEEDGTFTATFDLRSATVDAEYTAVVIGEDGQLSEPVEGTIHEPGTEVSTVGMETNARVTAGKTVRLNVSMPSTGNVELRIGDRSEVGYQVTVALYDRDADGEVGVHFDTAAAGTADPTVSVTDGDGYEIVQPETSLDGPLGSGEYPLTLYEDATDEDPVTLGQLTITDGERSTEASGGNGDETGSDATYADTWWYEAAPGIAGIIAIVSGLLSLRQYRR
jgi:hypothetical protein